MPFAGNRALAPIELLEHERSIVDGPAMDGGMIDLDASFGHHLLEISQAQAVSQIPPNAQQDYRTIKMAALEHRTPPEHARGVCQIQLPMGWRQFRSCTTKAGEPREPHDKRLAKAGGRRT
jgi:hypothetical protein